MNKKIFGIECPGCGIQRAFSLIFKGEFTDAFFMFPAVYTTIVFFIFIGLNFLDKSRNYHKLIISFAIVNALIMITAYIYKITNF